MRASGMVAISMLTLLAGCAHALTSTRLASAPVYLCKHCNCFMPANTDEHAICSVCRCGYPAHACRRGK